MVLLRDQLLSLLSIYTGHTPPATVARGPSITRRDRSFGCRLTDLVIALAYHSGLDQYTALPTHLTSLTHLTQSPHGLMGIPFDCHWGSGIALRKRATQATMPLCPLLPSYFDVNCTRIWFRQFRLNYTSTTFPPSSPRLCVSHTTNLVSAL